MEEDSCAGKGECIGCGGALNAHESKRDPRLCDDCKSDAHPGQYQE